MVAVLYLRINGYKIRHRNWKHKRGELDIVAAKDTTLIVVEVKTRRARQSSSFSPFDSIHHHKERALILLAAQYLTRFAKDLRRQNLRTIRFDTIGITLRTRTVVPVIEHRKGAIQPRIY